MIERIRCWLIERLGGFVEQRKEVVEFETVVLDRTNVHPVALCATFDVETRYRYEYENYIKRDMATRLARDLVDGGFLEVVEDEKATYRTRHFKGMDKVCLVGRVAVLAPEDAAKMNLKGWSKDEH